MINDEKAKRLTQEQTKVAMYVQLLADIGKNLNRCLYENKQKKISLSDLQAVSIKSCIAIKKMSDKIKVGFLEQDELDTLQKLEDEINYEVVIGKFEKKFRWEYTKNLAQYIKELSDRVLKRSGIERASFFI